MLLLLASFDPAARGFSSRWQLVSVDPDRPRADDTGIGGTHAVPVHELAATVSDDAVGAVLWGFDAGAPATRIDLTDGSQAALAVPARTVESLGFLALPAGAAQLWADGTVTLYDRDGEAVQTLDAHQAPVRDLALSPDGTWAVTVGDGGAVVLWDVDAPTGRWSQRELLTGHRGDVVMAEIDPAGRQLVTASLDDTVIAWDMTGDAGFGALYPPTGSAGSPASRSSSGRDCWSRRRGRRAARGSIRRPRRTTRSAWRPRSSTPNRRAGRRDRAGRHGAR
ncbi:WD40 repeat domain-containing protein [Blastococcus brunescens]|uniref:WD40 repeat domain-containing protein n=1 Tax=Blastococcus brunescens TaxID=1564165 RepID=A0ABZ1AWS5_9ACTN|nr:WD40 repeat domain-containing protein [Blastococcus sp. BMG 8361]WRL62960.1 WD40 repeat domain-containing protein [Blastococcus sp. BMG 8361]